MPSLPRHFAAAALLAVTACAGAPARPAAVALETVVWPPPPAEARLRLAAILPDPSAPSPRRPWWRIVLDVITGAEQREEGRNALARPFGVVLDGAGVLFAADPDAARVVRIDARGTLDELRCKDVPWMAPMAVAIAPDHSLLVADAAAATVIRWSEAGCHTLGSGLFERPTGIAAAADRIWVTDPPRHRVLALSYSGEILARIGERGDGEGRFNFPSAVAAAPDGTVLVVDALNFRIVRLAADGRWLGAFGEPGDEGGALARPKGIAIDGDGTIFVSDAQRDSVLVFTPDGTLLYAVQATGEGPGHFVHPAGLWVGSGRLAVADSLNRRIQVFELIGERQ